jgi:aldehyde dehydrogenase
MDMFELKRFNLDIAYPYKQQYDNFIGGKWVAPLAGRYFDNVSPITGKPFCRVAQSGQDAGGRALQHPAAHCRPHGAEPGAAGDRRDHR